MLAINVRFHSVARQRVYDQQLQLRRRHLRQLRAVDSPRCRLCTGPLSISGHYSRRYNRKPGVGGGNVATAHARHVHLLLPVGAGCRRHGGFVRQRL